MKIQYKDVYETYCKLIIHAEAISWQRFHVFLVVNSVLVLAWVTLYKDQRSLAGNLILCAIAVIGIVAALAWEDLGDRGRKYMDKYKTAVGRIEEDFEKPSWWEEGIAKDIRPFQIYIAPKWYSSSKFLLRFGPLVFLLLHSGLLVATWTR